MRHAAGGTVRVHFKSNRASAGSWPNSEEGERVFGFTKERYREAAKRHAAAGSRTDPVFAWDLEGFEESMATANVLVTWDFPTEKLAERAPNLKWIHIVGAGVEHLMPPDWLPKGVALTNSKGVHARKSGEYGLMAILMLNNSMPALIAHQQSASYRPVYGTPLEGKTLLIVGVGKIGGAVAAHANRLGMRVVGIRRSGRHARHVDEMHKLDDLGTLLPRADFVLVSAPNTPVTAGLLDATRLASMKPTAGLINVSRAALVDYDALGAMLKAGKLGGAVLDVFDPEPLPPTSPLWATPNLIVTPHVSSDEHESYVPLVLDLFFENMERYLEGRPLLNRVRPEFGY